MAFCFYSFGQKVGDKVSVKKNGKYYKATIKQVKGSKYYVDYDNYKSSWNEWVGKDRLKLTKSGDNKTDGKTDVNPKNNTSKNNTAWKVGDKIMVKKNETWLPASILQISGGVYKIHYDGYESSKNDEWVPTSRMKNR